MYANRLAYLDITPRLLVSRIHASSSGTTTPKLPSDRSTDKHEHFDILDWYEQQLLEENPNNHLPPRPTTAHGEKDAETLVSGWLEGGTPVKSMLAAKAYHQPSIVIVNEWAPTSLAHGALAARASQKTGDFDFEDASIPAGKKTR